MTYRTGRIQVKNGNIVYKVPEEMLPHVAAAMVSGGTATWLEDNKPKVESSTLDRAKEMAASVARPIAKTIERAVKSITPVPEKPATKVPAQLKELGRFTMVED